MWREFVWGVSLGREFEFEFCANFLKMVKANS